MPSVVLPEPDSPTMPSVSPLFKRQRHVVDGDQQLRLAGEHAPQRKWYSTRSSSVSSTTLLAAGTGFGRPDGAAANSFRV